MDPNTVADEIRSNSKFFPYFENAIGAIDGSHIPISVGLANQGKYRNRKKFISQNVLAVCNFDFTFSFLVAGWEGSATDSRVLNESLSKGLLSVPPGKYYVADAGYALTTQFITPYRNVRYHLKEWGRGNERYLCLT